VAAAAEATVSGALIYVGVQLKKMLTIFPVLYYRYIYTVLLYIYLASKMYYLPSLHCCKQGVHVLDHRWPSSALAESYYAG
jgi:hypothetical protein